MELLQLKYFCQSAQTQNFSIVAEKNFVPVSSISQSIKRLEKELGVSLFFRTANKVLLSEEGKVFYNYAKKALDSLQNGKDCVKDFSNDKLTGQIRIFCSIKKQTVNSAIFKFSKKYPGVNFTIRHYPDDNCDFDLIISSREPCNYKQKYLIETDSISFVMSDKHPLANKPTLTIEDVKNERFIVGSKNSISQNYLNMIFAQTNATPNIVAMVDTPQDLRTFLVNNFGISLCLSSWKDNYNNGLVYKPIENLAVKSYIYLINNGYTSRATQMFLDSLLSEFSYVTDNNHAPQP